MLFTPSVPYWPCSICSFFVRSGQYRYLCFLKSLVQTEPQNMIVLNINEYQLFISLGAILAQRTRKFTSHGCDSAAQTAKIWVCLKLWPNSFGRSSFSPCFPLTWLELGTSPIFRLIHLNEAAKQPVLMIEETLNLVH
jgi:hypothetical protein